MQSGMLKSMGSQRVRHDWATEQQYNVVLVSVVYLSEAVYIYTLLFRFYPIKVKIEY